MNLEVKIEGVPEVIRAFEKVQDGVADLRKNAIWLRVQQAFYKAVKAIFASEGGKSGKWQDLKSPYKEIKAKKYGTPILVATGRFKRSLTQDGGEAIVDKQATEMTLGSSVPYGKFHQTGTKKMPARKPIDFTEDAEKRILQPIGDGLRQLIDNARLGGR